MSLDTTAQSALTGISTAVFDVLDVGVLICNRQGRLLYVNPFFLNLLAAPSSRNVGRPIEELFDDPGIAEVLASGQASESPDFIYRPHWARNDQRLHLRVHRIPFGDASNGGGGAVVLASLGEARNVGAILEELAECRKGGGHERRSASLAAAAYSFDAILGQSRIIQEKKRLARKYAASEKPVLLLAPTGAGKEMFAHAIHLASARHEGPFLCVNCAAIPRELLESELFGYETGAFTGARARGKPGKIEQAHNGTLFLDEIGELSLSAQAKLLRVLENKRLEKLGGKHSVFVDFRIISATNRDLGSMIQRREFRDDLYFRLNTMTLRIPPLCQRREDIPIIARHILAAQKPQVRIAPEAMERMQEYPWPGNIRELKGVLERAFSIMDGSEITVDVLPFELRTFKPERKVAFSPYHTDLAKEVARFEKGLLEKFLTFTHGNKAKAARLLNISRTTLYDKCRLYGLDEKPAAGGASNQGS